MSLFAGHKDSDFRCQLQFIRENLLTKNRQQLYSQEEKIVSVFSKSGQTNLPKWLLCVRAAVAALGQERC